MRKRINISKDFLYQAYIVNKKTTYQIAIEVGCSRTTICNYLRKFGINIGRTYKTGKNHPFFGKHHSELTKKNIAKKKRRDYYRFKVYKRNNYKTLIIWEHELKDIDKITNKILEFNNGQTTRKTV